MPCGDTIQRLLSVNQKDTLHQELNSLGTLISNFGALKLGEINEMVLATQSIGFYYRNPKSNFGICICGNQNNVELVLIWINTSIKYSKES